MWEFAKDSPIITLLIVWILAWAAVQPFRYAYLSYNRKLRSRNIAAQGYPTAPNMDADGDIVHPECECKS